jgi:hypothetical protein
MAVSDAEAVLVGRLLKRIGGQPAAGEALEPIAVCQIALDARAADQVH